MTKHLLCWILAAVSVPVSGLFAQAAVAPFPAPAKALTWQSDENTPLDANDVVSVYPADKKGPEASVLVATQSFSVSNTVPSLTFDGRLIPQENGSQLLYYHLGGAGALTHSSVLLRPGDTAQIVKNGDQFYNLRLDRYNPVATAKGAAAGSTEAASGSSL